MNLPSVQFTLDVAKVGDRIIIHKMVIAPSGSSSHEHGHVTFANVDEFKAWLDISADRIMDKLP